MNTRWIYCSLALIALSPAVSQAKNLELVLRLQERVSMEVLADNVINPDSPRYGQYYTPEEIRALAGPSDFDYLQTLQKLEAKGLSIIGEDKTHLFVTVSGDSSAIEQAFGVQLEFLDADQNLHHAIQSGQPSHDLTLITSVIGLDNTRRSRSHYKMIQPTDIGGEDGGFQPDQIKSIYGFNSIYQAGFTGKGQHIAIATYDMYHELDPQQYWAYKDIQPVPQMDTVYFNGHPNINDDSCMETELDVEFSGMIAPGAQIHVFPSAHNDDSGEVQLFTAILDDNRAKVANYSWGDCEADVDPQHVTDMNQVFARAVAQGVNVMAASGDSGSFGCPTDSRGAPGKVNADWPAANAYVVAVGGTSLDTTGDGDAKETSWASSGGGVSVFFDQPSWQQGFQAPFTKRAFPDVAFNADPNTGESALVHWDNQQFWLQFGGTSIAAPQWSGFLALVAEARTGSSTLGYLNPIIYALSAQDKAAAFHDVTKGSNGAYQAGPGWDAATGWGSMRASALFDILRKH